MFGGEKDNKKEKDKQISIGTGITIDKLVQKMTAQADAVFTKPEYNPRTRKSHYDNGSAHKAAKENAFSRGGVVRDPYTDAELVATIKEAKMRFGSNWQDHLAEADHIDPLSRVAKRAGNKPWVTAEDVKNIGNSQDNFQTISRRMNQNGGKGGSSQTEWSRNAERMQRISRQTGESADSIAERIRQTGEAAEKRNNVRFTRAGVKNAAATAHAAGKSVAVEAGGTAASISGICNIVSCIKGEKTAAEALKDTARDGAKAHIYGYANGAGLTVLNHTLTSSNSELLKAFGENNVAGKVITTVSVAGGTVIKWGNGEISTEECLVELGDKGCSFGGAYYGSILGQAIIPVPFIGGAVGSLIGGTLTSGVYNVVIQGIQSAVEKERLRQQEIYEMMMRYYAEQKRREEVQQLIRSNTEREVVSSVWSIIQSGEFQRLVSEIGDYFTDRAESERRIAECVLVTLQLQEYHRQLHEYVDTYFSKYEKCFESAFELMDSSLRMGNYDGAIVGVNRVTEMFGNTPTVKSTEDFRNKIFGNSSISL